MHGIANWFLALLGKRLIYVCDWGTYEVRYDWTDIQMSRPIHRGMAVAPPWAKACIVKG